MFQGLKYFYLVSVTLIFAIAMAIQLPKFNCNANVKMIVFVAWAAYGVLPTFHWTIIMGGFANPIVEVSTYYLIFCGKYLFSSIIIFGTYHYQDSI